MAKGKGRGAKGAPQIKMMSTGKGLSGVKPSKETVRIQPAAKGGRGGKRG